VCNLTILSADKTIEHRMIVQIKHELEIFCKELYMPSRGTILELAWRD
jgi:hypothetical protein